MDSSQKLWREAGVWLKRKREEAGLSQEGAGRKVGMTRQQWFRLENGLGGTKRETVLRICRALGLDEKEGLEQFGYSNGATPREKPQNAAEFAERLREMGFEIQTQFEWEQLGPDDLQDIIDDIEDKLIAKTMRRKREAVTR